MAKFQLLSGHYQDTEGRDYRRGAIVKSDEDLEAKFRNSFKRVGIPVPDPSIVDPDLKGLLKERQAKKLADEMADPTGSEQDKPKGKKTGKISSAPAKPDAAALAARGKDVTERFAKAADEGFVVTRREKLFHVYEGDSLSTVDGGEGLAEDAVVPFLTKFLDG